MITVSGLTHRFGSRDLFNDVNIIFTPGNCYGLIGANGSGKSTFLKILSGEIESSKGNISIAPGKRIAILKQNHFEFDEFKVLETVIMGHKRLYDIMREKDAIYLKPDFSNEDGIRAAELECEFAELNGWEADSQAGTLLNALGIKTEFHDSLMSEMSGTDKVRALLAQALFGNPDILLMDEPTNHLDVDTIMWLEEFLINFENTVIIVSHDRQFLDKVCTHIADIDYNKIQLYTGNFSFWRESSQLALKQKQDQNKKTEEKMEELKSFIARFSANASKSKQATSRKNVLSKLTLEEIKPSTRRSPYIIFKPDREAGDNILHIEKLSKSVDDSVLFKNFSLTVERGEKIAFVGRDNLAASTLFQILTGEQKADKGSFKWGVSTTQAYFPKDNSKYFENDLTLVDWLRQYSKEKDENFIRGFLGKMLFSGEESLKKINVLSGGEKVRCMFSKMMITGANVLIFDEPTNHLDLESIEALNNALISFPGTVLFLSHDHQFIESIANRIIELTPAGWINEQMTYDQYIIDPKIKKRRAALYDYNAVKK
ncbi:MAG TPA: ATP-binding cassette domain-containing protein [Candidatus Gastranaerophilales bacterium]|nr:ATP-binding cassette domain-containing protein [Candidatus Gastranaerophilales bacterium]